MSETSEVGDFPGHLLHQASLWDNAELLLDLLRGDLGSEIESQDSWGRTALHASATTLDSRCLEVLLQHGANPNAISGGQDNFKTPLHTTAEYGFLSNVKKLVKAGADVTSLEGRAMTAADLALRGGHHETHNFLVTFSKDNEIAREDLHASLRESVTEGDVNRLKTLLRPISPSTRKELLNKTPHGTNSLLFKACEAGMLEMVEVLLENGRDAKNHPVTKYSPLHIASYHGHRAVVNRLLEKFPSLAGCQTVEKWLPIHAACINGHTGVLDLLLSFNYPEDLLHTFRLPNSESEYEMPFDVNQKDVSDQTCLYIACQMGNPRLVEILLKHRVSKKGSTNPPEPTSPTRGKVSEGIQGIIKRLSISITQPCTVPPKDVVCPVDVNLYCEEYQTALHLSVKAKHYAIVAALLGAGADPNLAIRAPTSTYVITTGDPKAQVKQESSALAEACKNRDLGMIDLLLKFGARDEDSLALGISSRDDVILGKLLTLKVYFDAEGVLNPEEIQNQVHESGGKKLLATSLLPKVPVNVNWHAQKLTKVSDSWLVSAGLKLNPKLRLAPVKGEAMALQALTRIDLSNNQLDSVSPTIFKLTSLMYLNLSGNKITKIHLPPSGASGRAFLSRLQELLIHENRIETCPSSLFTEFTSLVTLNLSNNKLESLPATMWLAPKLQELNVSLNLIRDLPQGPQSQGDPSSRRVSSGSAKRRSSARSRKSTDSLNHEAMWRHSITVGEQVDEVQGKCEGPGNSIVSLNLSHNSFPKIPAPLACWATKIQRLNMAFNSLKELGEIGDYPVSLRHIDLSHNKIRSWFCPQESTVSNCCIDLTSPCQHRNRFRRLDNLKTIILSGNALSSLEISFDDQLLAVEGRKAFIWFPNLTTLDLSENKLTELSHKVSSLSQLSVLNLSRNKVLTELPPQLGLLSRIWNLNLQGCKLQEPLKSLVERKGSKTIDVMGYLKSVLEDAKPYARMKLMTVGVHGIGKTTLLTLLRQEGTGKGSDTWTKRMGNTASSKGGKLMSTVGVDIGHLVLEKGNRGPVTFRTWDFGGQKEYYATHSYFLSKRSLYLLLWNICDGERGLREVHSWLVNIQGRAPNSPVIIVGTHYDLVSEKFPPGYLDYLEQKIREKFICISDPEKRGLPRVLTSLEISCRSKYNIKNLATVIYDAAVTLKTSNGKFLLEQHVPSKYIHLEEIVGFLSAERKSRSQDPVLTEEEFKTQAESWLENNYGLKFRDEAEISQACTFLHENGILLHFGELYFLDPQWLCDVLANVVTIREINPFCQGGSMRIQDLTFLFKGRSKATQDYILDLLSKFELAIPYDGVNLLIPSLLPTTDEMKMGHNEVRVKISLRSRSWMLGPRGRKLVTLEENDEDVKDEVGIWTPERKELGPLTRFLTLSYFPSGFWPRLMSRILSDDRVMEIVRRYFVLPPASGLTCAMVSALDQPAEWLCWQTGFQLQYGDLLVIRIREISGGDKPHTFTLKRDDEGDLVEICHERKDESIWDPVDLNEAGLLEIHLPCLALVEESSGSVLHPSLESVTKLLTLGVEAVDTLLEDWYPSIGTRFVHTSEGKYLVTRICPCPFCFHVPPTHHNPSSSRGTQPPRSKSMSSDSGVGNSPSGTSTETDPETAGMRMRTGLAFETPKFGRTSEISAGLNFFLGPESKNLGPYRNYYAWTIESIILEAQSSESRRIKCPTHGDIHIGTLAPDILFFDLPTRYLLKSEDLTRNQLLGRGAFGFVFSGTLKGTLDVAIKSFHPIDPGDANEEAVAAYRAAKTKWCRSPTQSACRAYLASRGEIRVLYWVSHPHIVPLLGLLQTSLSIVMPRAPRGALDTVLADYARSGDFVTPVTAQQCIIQISKALEYLHGHQILYRDLKAENVLVWAFPAPFSKTEQRTELKLADYGISRSSLPTGNKGFGGTEGFIAPEVIRFNGEEEYTELVDTFSLGMVIFQILSLKQPYDGCENIKESILEGVRPAMIKPERYPMYMLDLMVACWQNLPKDRPTASQVLKIASAPEFTLVRDVVSVGTPPAQWELNVVTSHGLEDELWASCSTGTIYSVQVRDDSFTTCEAFAFIPGAVTALSKIGNQVWMGDISADIHIFELEGERTSRQLDLKSFLGDNLGACISIQPVGLTLVATAFSSGRLFLLKSENGELVTELGQAASLHSIVTRMLEQGSAASEIWTGENGGVMRIFSLHGSQVVGQQTVSHNEVYEGDMNSEATQVLLMNTHPKKEFIFSYLFPGRKIYSWNGDKRQICMDFDVGKVVNGCESQEAVLCKKLHLTALHSTDDWVFVGTNTGFVVILTLQLHQVSTFHPFSKDVRSFCVYSPPPSPVPSESETEEEDVGGIHFNPTKLIAFGKSFVHLFDMNAQEQRRAYAILCSLNSQS